MPHKVARAKRNTPISVGPVVVAIDVYKLYTVVSVVVLPLLPNLENTQCCRNLRIFSQNLSYFKIMTIFYKIFLSLA